MELLQLSSISAGWINFGSLGDTSEQAKLATYPFFAALAMGGVAIASADPHWGQMKEPGHFAHIDDECLRLHERITGKAMTAEELAGLNSVPELNREFARRLLTSKRMEAILGRISDRASRILTPQATA